MPNDSATANLAPTPAQPVEELATVFDNVLGAYLADGFDAGYHRALNDMLADFVLVAEEFIRDQGQGNASLREALRAFHRRFETHIDNMGAPKQAGHAYVDGGLGI